MNTTHESATSLADGSVRTDQSIVRVSELLAANKEGEYHVRLLFRGGETDMLRDPGLFAKLCDAINSVPSAPQ